MRIAAITLSVLLAAGASTALAAPATVTVTVGEKMQEKAVETYGVAEVDRLAAELRREVEAALARTGAYTDSRIELILVDAVPNRPTFKQLGEVDGLSSRSFGIGGAEIEGRAVSPDGTVTTLHYKWYETDIERAATAWTWADTAWAFDRFAYRLARGEDFATR
jgi:hypothetical protein